MSQKRLFMSNNGTSRGTGLRYVPGMLNTVVATRASVANQLVNLDLAQYGTVYVPGGALSSATRASTADYLAAPTGSP